MEPERVVEVWAPAAAGGGTFGSGYLVDGELVLTAGHVLDGTAGGACEVRPLGASAWQPARLRWRGSSCDAALLELADGVRVERARLGRLATTARAPCRAVGFPRAQAAGEQRDTEAIAGTIEPLTALKSGLLTVHVEGGPPQAGPSGWEGISGAAVWVGSLLVGVIVVVPAGFAAHRVAAVPTSTMAEDPRFAAAFGAPPVLEAVEDVATVAGVLAEGYLPIPARDDWGRAASFLLEPEFGVVPFHGRQDELAELDAWCDGDAGLAVGLMIGRGGAGKTRLAAELCLRRRARGMPAGMLMAGAQFGELTAVSGPLLIVVDEAHSRIDEIVALLRRLVSAPRTVPLRALLIARNAGAWWSDRLPEQLEAAPDARLALVRAQVRELGPVDETTPEREAAFHAAIEAFGERVGRPTGEISTPDLSQPLFDSILFVHLAALTALEGRGDLLQGAVARDDLLGAALEREARYWRSTADSHELRQLDRAVLRRAVAVATLTPAAGETEAAGALEAVPDLTGAQQHLLRQVARWLRDLYPVPHDRTADGWLRPLSPELLGDALLGSVLNAVPRLASELLGRVDEPKPVLATVTRASRTQTSAEAALRLALEERFDAAWEAAIEVGQEVGDPIGRVVLDVLQAQPRPDLVIDILNALPTKSVSLRELTLSVASQAVFALGTRVDARDVARVHRRLSAGWADLGEHERALGSTEIEVSMYRYLVEHTPDASEDLVGALNNLSVRLGAVGRKDEALAAIEEAVDRARDVDAAEPDLLAGSLVNLALALDGLRRREEALRANMEALTVLRPLAEDDPDEFEPKLAICLSNVSTDLSAAGRVTEALSAIDESVRIYRRLAARRPDTYRPDLGAALTNYASVLGRARRSEEALSAAEEAVVIYRDLAEARPGAFADVLAAAVGSLGDRLADLGRHDEAVAAAEHAVATARRRGPDADPRPLATALSVLVKHLASEQRFADSVAAEEELVGIRRDLADERSLAEALDDLATAYHGLGRHPDGVAARNEAIALYRALRLDHECASSLSMLAHHFLETGRDEDALAAARESVSLDRAAAREQPERFMPGLAMTLSLLSHAADALGLHAEALDAIEESVAGFRRLAAREPEKYRRMLAMTLNNDAAVLGKVGRHKESVRAATEAVELYRPLAEQLEDPSLYEFILTAHGLSVSLRKLGRTDEAEAVLEEARRFAALYEDGPSGPWQRDPALAGRFHPSYPNDLEVRFYFAEQQTLEKMWVRTTGVDEEIGGYVAVLVNRPHTDATGLAPGASVAYRVAAGMPDPIWVTPAMRANLASWSSRCERCGFDMLLLPAEDLIRRQFELPPGTVMEAFTTRCLACGEGMVVRKRGTTQRRA